MFNSTTELAKPIGVATKGENSEFETQPVTEEIKTYQYLI